MRGGRAGLGGRLDPVDAARSGRLGGFEGGFGCGDELGARGAIGGMMDDGGADAHIDRVRPDADRVQRLLSHLGAAFAAGALIDSMGYRRTFLFTPKSTFEIPELEFEAQWPEKTTIVGCDIFYYSLNPGIGKTV